LEDIDKTLEKSVHTQDILGIRNVLATFITQDQGFSTGIFDEKVKYCLNQGIREDELFEKFNEEQFEGASEKWTNEYYALQRTRFRANFSRERLAHLKKVGRKLFPSASASPGSSPSEEVKKKYGSLWWIAAAGIGAAAILWLLLRRK
jgi:hypothetical protein